MSGDFTVHVLYPERITWVFCGASGLVFILVYARLSAPQLSFKNNLIALPAIAGIGAGVMLMLPKPFMTIPAEPHNFYKSGSLLGMVIGLYLALQVIRWMIGKDTDHVSRALGIALLPAIAVARLGCFLRGCCHGIVCDERWAVVYSGVDARVTPSLRDVPVHPTQLYEALACALGAVFVILLSKSNVFRKYELHFAFAMMCYAVVRFSVEFWKSKIGQILVNGINATQLLTLVVLLLAVLKIIRKYLAVDDSIQTIDWKCRIGNGRRNNLGTKVASQEIERGFR